MKPVRLPFDWPQISHGLRRQRLATNAPIAALDFRNLDPGDAAPMLSFYGHERIRESLDHLALLFGAEDVLDHVNFNQWHVHSFGLLRRCAAMPACTRSREEAFKD
jgi:hypothetical protein